MMGKDHGIDWGCVRIALADAKILGGRYLRKRTRLGNLIKCEDELDFRNIASRILRRLCQICDTISCE